MTESHSNTIIHGVCSKCWDSASRVHMHVTMHRHALYFSHLLVGVFGALCTEEGQSHEVVIPGEVPAGGQAHGVHLHLVCMKQCIARC
jgi:hypothetical protein